MPAHLILIIAHAGFGVLACVAGGLALTRSGWLPAYRWSFAGLVLTLAGAITVGWGGFGPVERILFPGLLLLGGYCVVRAVRTRPSDSDPVSCADPARAGRYLDDVGFGLISLFVGFVAVGVLDLGAPGWAAAVVAVAASVLGPRVLAGIKRRRLRTGWAKGAIRPVAMPSGTRSGLG